MASKNKKKKKGKVIFITILSILVVLLGATGGYLLYLRSLGTFINRTSLNGYDVSNKKPEEVVAMLMDGFGKTGFSLTERGEVDLDCSLAELGLSLNEADARSMVEQALKVQNSNVIQLLTSVISGKSFRMEIPYTVDEAVFQSKMKAENLSQPRIPTEDAGLKRDENGHFYVSDEVYGTDFDDTEFQNTIKEQINEQLTGMGSSSSALLTGKVDLAFPEQIYKVPQVLSTEPRLVQERDAYNNYCNAEVVYQFGSQTEVVDWRRIQKMIVMDEGNVHLDENLVYELVGKLARKYDTRYLDRTFTTTYGSTITIPGYLNEYGYTVNQDAEFYQLLEDLNSNTKVTREPIYYEENDFGNPYYYAREGVDDLNGTYVEVNLTDQHLWFYINGSMIFETDFVSGCVATNHETQTGVFPLAYKKSPDVLVGQDYNCPVQYWMPFYEGQGLHDATWRGSFGGNIYQYDGSHGCLNLSLYSAGVIYENIEAGMPLVIYK